MQDFEYRVIPAPMRGERGRGARSSSERLANSLTRLMNRMARDGWEYLRADTLPLEERTGLLGREMHFEHLLVFRRGIVRKERRAPRAARGWFGLFRARPAAEEQAEDLSSPSKPAGAEPVRPRQVTAVPPKASDAAPEALPRPVAVAPAPPKGTGAPAVAPAAKPDQRDLAAE